MNHYNLVHKFIPMPQAIKIPDAKAAVDKAWKKLEKIPAWKFGTSLKQERGHPGGTKRQKKSPLCFINRHLSSKERGVGTQTSKVLRTCCTPW